MTLVMLLRFDSSCSIIREGETIKYNLRLTTTSLLIHTLRRLILGVFFCLEKEVKMEIEKVKISDLLEYKYNAKEHPEWQIEQIVNSIKQFGFNDPIAIDENNTIIEGHGRLYALQELGETEVDCIRLSHLDEEQKRAYILAHNKLTMNTDFDLDLLQLELDNIIDIDMSDFGFEISKEMEVEANKNTEIKEIQDDSVLIVEADSENELEELYNEFQERGIKCRVSIL